MHVRGGRQDANSAALLHVKVNSTPNRGQLMRHLQYKEAHTPTFSTSPTAPSVSFDSWPGAHQPRGRGVLQQAHRLPAGTR